MTARGARAQSSAAWASLASARSLPRPKLSFCARTVSVGPRQRLFSSAARANRSCSQDEQLSSPIGCRQTLGSKAERQCSACFGKSRGHSNRLQMNVGAAFVFESREEERKTRGEKREERRKETRGGNILLGWRAAVLSRWERCRSLQV